MAKVPYHITISDTDYSGPQLHYRGDPIKKAYRAHISFDMAENNWVGWVTYGPARSPDSNNSVVVRNQNLFVVIDQLNERLTQKTAKGYSVPGLNHTSPYIPNSVLWELNQNN